MRAARETREGGEKERNARLVLRVPCSLFTLAFTAEAPDVQVIQILYYCKYMNSISSLT